MSMYIDRLCYQCVEIRNENDPICREIFAQKQPIRAARLVFLTMEVSPQINSLT